jgi:hypothetical protein
MPLSTKLLVQLAADLTSPLDLTTAASPTNYAQQIVLADGTGAGQANKIWSSRRVLAASANEDIDLQTVTDPFGAAIALAKVRLLLVFAEAGNSNNVVLGNAAANQWVGPFGAATHTHAIKPGGLYATAATDAAGWAVSGSAKNLRVANAGGGSSVAYRIIVVGTN